MKKVAVILTQSIENDTSSAIRCRNIISAIAALDYDLTCYCPHPNTDSIYYGKTTDADRGFRVVRYGEKAPVYDGIKAQQAQGLKAKILRFCAQCFRKVDVFGSSLLYLRYQKDICQQMKGENYDILLTFSDPMTAHMIGKYCAKRLDVKYIQQWGDPLTTDVISKIAHPRWLRYLIEKSLLRPADRVCYVSPLTCEEQCALFPKDAHKMMFLPTPCVAHEKPEPTAPSARVTIGYFGSYNLVARDLRPLYEAAARVDGCELLVIGDSDLKLEPKDNIRLIDRIPQKDLAAHINNTQVLVCLMNSHGNQVPGKTYHYAGSYQEILLIKDGEFGDKIQEFFSKYDRYTFVDNDPDKIEAVLRGYVEHGVPQRAPLDAFRAEHIAAELMRDI